MAEDDPGHALTLRCPSCGAGLEITPDLDTFACGYCGTRQVVRRAGGTVSLKILTDAVAEVKAAAERIEAGTDRVATELAISRLRHDLVDTDDECHCIDEKISKLKNKNPINSIGAAWVGCLGVPLGLPLGFILLFQLQLGFCPGALVLLLTPVVLAVIGQLVADSIHLGKLNTRRAELESRRADIRGQIDRLRTLLGGKGA